MQQNIQKERLAYMDALRGLTMVILVYSHVVTLCYDSVSPLVDIFEHVREPLFFFISGFFFNYKLNSIAEKGGLGGTIASKARRLLVPPVIIGGIYMVTHHHEVYDALCDPKKIGYWFTLVLFYFVLLSGGITMLCRKARQHTRFIIMLAVYLIGFVALNRIERMEQYETVIAITSIRHFYHYLFFVAGHIANAYYPQFKSFIHTFASAIFLVVFGIGTVVCMGYSTAYNSVNTCVYTLLALCFICFLCELLCHNEDKLNTRTYTCLQTIGRYSLDIYLIHYFFLPLHMGQDIDCSFIGNHIAIEIVATMALTGIIIYLTILTGKLIRAFPFIKQLVWG